MSGKYPAMYKCTNSVHLIYLTWDFYIVFEFFFSPNSPYTWKKN